MVGPWSRGPGARIVAGGGVPVCRDLDRTATAAIEWASVSSVLRPCPVSNTRTRAASFAGTSSTRSPSRSSRCVARLLSRERWSDRVSSKVPTAVKGPRASATTRVTDIRRAEGFPSPIASTRHQTVLAYPARVGAPRSPRRTRRTTVCDDITAGHRHDGDKPACAFLNRVSEVRVLSGAPHQRPSDLLRSLTTLGRFGVGSGVLVTKAVTTAGVEP
jgi:hypothetical protein